MRDRTHDLEDNQLDALLDAALASYVLAEREDEAVGGVTAGTMAAVHAESAFTQKSKRLVGWPLLALPIAAALVLLMVLPARHLRSAHEVHTVPSGFPRAVRAPEQARVESPQVETTTAKRRVNAHAHRPVVVAPEPLPKLDVFPTPRPLSPELQALVDMAERNPKQAEQALTVSEQKPIEPLETAPLTIAAIEVQPLSPPEKDRGNKDK